MATLQNNTDQQLIDNAIEKFLQVPQAVNAVKTADPKSVLFIDSGVEDYESLLKGVKDNVDVYILDSNSDGVQQIADVLKTYSNLESVQVISHGGTGEVTLGDTVLDNSSLNSYEAQLQSWGNSLTENGDILLYGCNVAENGSGLVFITRLGGMTNAEVAASNDITGAAALGGDWDLERTTGLVEAPNALNDVMLSPKNFKDKYSSLF